VKKQLTSSALDIWAQICIEAARKEPERYPLIASLLVDPPAEQETSAESQEHEQPADS
jgi:hypothetical protein